MQRSERELVIASSAAEQPFLRRRGGLSTINPQPSTSSSSPAFMKYQTYLIFGAPGSGKGTQGKILGAVPRFFHCACVEVFRQLDTRTAVGQAFLAYSTRGQLVPDDITVKLLLARLRDMVASPTFKPDIDS